MNSDDSPSRKGTFRWFNAFRNRSESTRNQLDHLLQEEVAKSEPEFTPTERNFLRNILALRGLQVDDVMVPRADVGAVDVGSTIGEVMEEFTRFGHSRMPAYRENLDDPIGFVHVKDLINYLMETAEPGGSSNPVAEKATSRKLESLDLVREALYVPPSMPVLDLFVIMQTTRVHLALIIDEYGGTDGLATFEDLVEAVVGDIVDEHDNDDGPLLRKINESSHLVNGRIELSELRENLGDKAFENLGEIEEEVDTLSGLIVTLAGHVPVRGEIISLSEEYEVKVIEADPKRIKLVSLVRLDPKQPAFELTDGKTVNSAAIKEEVGDEADEDRTIDDIETAAADPAEAQREAS